MRRTHAPDLRSRRGDGLIAWFMLFLPLALVLLNLALNGLSVAFAYRRAQGLARLAAATGAGAVVFDGGRTWLETRAACERAYQTLERNGARTRDGVDARCAASAREIRVRVSLRPTLVLNDVFGLAPDRVVMEAAAQPVSGINEADE